jgi:ribosome-binding factor A
MCLRTAKSFARSVTAKRAVVRVTTAVTVTVDRVAVWPYNRYIDNKGATMTKQEAAVYYTAYAELEAAAEAFYAAANKMAGLMPTEANALHALCDAVNMQVVAVDTELDEVLA